jgi:hypothetical protein
MGPRGMDAAAAAADPERTSPSGGGGDELGCGAADGAGRGAGDAFEGAREGSFGAVAELVGELGDRGVAVVEGGARGACARG